MKLFYLIFLYAGLPLLIFSSKSSQRQILFQRNLPPALAMKFQPKEPGCPCLSEARSKCSPCNPYEFNDPLQGEMNAPPPSCSCAPRDLCPPCVMAKTQKFLHEQAEKEAKAQAQTEESLSREAQLQSKLFALAVKFAKEASQQEELARKAALALQQAASRAQIARNKMKRATNQARLLAVKTINTISLNQLDKNVIGMFGGPGKGIMDIPGSLEEAETNNDLETSSDLANDLKDNLKVEKEN